MRSTWLKAELTLLLLGTFTCAAHAETLVRLEGGTPKPSVVTTWRGEGKKVELEVRAGVDPHAVADAIQKGVERVRTKVEGGKVLVIGKTLPDLLTALGAIELGDATADLGELAALAAAEDDPSSGSSIRAKKTVDMKKLLADSKTVVQGRVVEVGGAFPSSVVTIKVIQSPTGELARAIRRGANIKIRPAYQPNDESIDWSDENNHVVLGINYARKNDVVRVKLGQVKDDVYEALLYDRR